VRRFSLSAAVVVFSLFNCSWTESTSSRGVVSLIVQSFLSSTNYSLKEMISLVFEAPNSLISLSRISLRLNILINRKEFFSISRALC
jgi:hypothetical protein